VAAKVDGLKQLLEARQQLANLVTYMDGKVGAEELLAKVIKDEACSSRWAAKAPPSEGRHTSRRPQAPRSQENVHQKRMADQAPNPHPPCRA
jgi:hypothetical protein